MKDMVPEFSMLAVEMSRVEPESFLCSDMADAHSRLMLVLALLVQLPHLVVVDCSGVTLLLDEWPEDPVWLLGLRDHAQDEVCAWVQLRWGPIYLLLALDRVLQ